MSAIYEVSEVVQELEEAAKLHEDVREIYLKEEKLEKASMNLSEIVIMKKFIKILKDKYLINKEISSFMLETIVNKELTYSERCVIAKVLDKSKDSVTIDRDKLDEKLYTVRSLVDIFITLN